LLAGSVVVFHYSHFAAGAPLSPPDPMYDPPFFNHLSVMFTSGYYAVNVFFFLSGYMLLTQICQDPSQEFNPKIFLTKRLARIYPAHLASLLLMGAISVIITLSDQKLFISYSDTPANFFYSILLLNGLGIIKDNSFNIPSWSLSVEMLCYIILAFICSHLRHRRIAPFLGGIIIGALITELSGDPNVDNVGTGLIFFFSGALAVNWKKYVAARSSMIVNLFTLLFIAVFSFFYATKTGLGAQKVIWCLVSLPAFVLAITLLDEQLAALKNRPFKNVGLFSFSIYVWHYPVQTVLFYLFDGFSADRLWYNAESTFLVYLLCTSAAGICSLVTVERLGYRLFGLAPKA
jgi:peptidoglycan/LPS O-acetylase OafA/YrhL